MEFAEKYKAEQFNFPGHNIDPKLKLLPEYAVEMATAIYSSYVGDKCSFPYSLMSYYDRVRQYSDGKQDAAIYEERLWPSDDNKANNTGSDFDGKWGLNKKRKGTNNINKEILSLSPRIMQSILGAFKDVDYNLQADTIDPDSGYEQEIKKSKLYSESQHIDYINMIKKQAGIPVSADSKYPKDLDELQLMDDLGEFKTGISKALEKLLKHTYDISDWEGDKEKLIKDLVNFNAICLHDYYDDQACKWKTQYEDVTRVIAQYSDKRDYADSCYYAIIKEKAVSEIRYKLEDAGYSEDKIGQLAQNWAGLLGNPPQSEWSDYSQRDKYGNWMYDFYKCLVMEYVWVENDQEYRTINTSRRGIRTVYEQDFGKIRNTDHNQTRITTIKRLYEAKWVIGTDIAYDNQIARSQPHDKNNKRPIMPFHIWVGTETAITQRLIPIFDNFQITWLKMQNDIIQSFGDILLIDQTVTDRVKIKGESWDTLKILKHAKATGTMPYRSLPANGKYGGGNVKPIEIIPSSIMNQIEKSIKLFEQALRMVEMLTGINPVALGAQPNSDAGKATTEMALQNTTKILRPIIDAVFKIKEDSAEFLSEAIRLAIRNDKDCRDAYSKVVGNNDVDALYQSNYEARELGIKLIPRPTDDELKSLYEDIRNASMPGKDGKPLIRFDVQLYIKEKLMTGANLSDIRLYLSNAINKEAERQDNVAQQNSQSQGQIIQQQNQAKAQMDMQAKEADFKFKSQLSAQEGQQAMDLEQLKQGMQRYQIEQEQQMREKELEQAQNKQTQPQNA